MSQKFEEIITVKATSQYGVMSGDVWFNVAKGAPFTPKSFEKGKSYTVSGYISDKGGKFMELVKEFGAGAPLLTVAVPAPTAAPIAAPAYPKAAPAPLASGSEDKMSKADWARKDVVIARQAVIKSVLESPSVANLVVGLDQAGMLTVMHGVAEDLESWVNRS